MLEYLVDEKQITPIGWSFSAARSFHFVAMSLSKPLARLFMGCFRLPTAIPDQAGTRLA
jgi:hypothetical protein